MSNIINDLFRSFFWFLGQFTLMLMDMLHTLIKTLTGFNILSLDFFWEWWVLLCAFLTFFIFLRVCSMFFKAMIDEEAMEKLNPLLTIVKIGVISIVIGLAPYGLNEFNRISIGMVDNISVFTGGDVGDDIKPSAIIFSSGLDEDVDFQKVDINDKENGEYKYLPTTWDILLCVSSALIVSFFYVLLSLQITKRAFDLAVKILISPLPISGIVNPNDQSFGTWLKLLIADLSANFLQMLVLYLVLKTCSHPFVVGYHILVRIMILIGGMMAIVAAPSGIAQLLGSDIGVGSMLQQIASLKYATAGIGAAFGGVKAGAMTAGAAAVYGGGRMMGGQGLLHNAGNMMNQAAGGGMKNKGASTATGSGTEGFASKMNGYSQEPAFSSGAEDTSKTAAMSSANVGSFDSDAGVNNEGASGFDSASPASASNQGEAKSSSGSYAQSGAASEAANSQVSESFSEGRTADASEPSTQAKKSPHMKAVEVNPEGGAKQATSGGSKFIAKKVSDYGKSNQGFKGAAARIVSTGGSHLYQNSARRLSTQKRNVRTGETNDSRFVQSSRAIYAVKEAVSYKPEPEKSASEPEGGEQ